MLLLTYLYAFPDKLADYVDTLIELNPFQGIQEEALFHSWCESILNNTPLLIPNLLEETVLNVQKRSILDNLKEEVIQMLNLLRLKKLKQQFSDKQKEYFKTENPTIKIELETLSKEIERLSNFNEE